MGYELGVKRVGSVCYTLSVGFGIGVTDFLLVVDTDLHVGDGVGEIAFLFVGEAQIPTGDRFPAAVADLTRNHQPLLVELDGAAGLAQVRVGIAQVAQRIAFPAAVADLTRDHQLLLVELDGAAGLAQVGVGQCPGCPAHCPSPRRSPISRAMTSACS